MSSRLRRVGLVAPGVVAVLSVVAALGFRGIFPDWTFLATALIGAVGATAISLLGRALGLLVPEAVALSLAGFALLGGVAAASVPTPSAYATFVDGLINGWAELLSSVPPASLVAEYRAVPYAVAWLAALVGCEILRSRHTDGLAVIGPVIGLALATLITVEDRSVALVQGAVLAVGAITLGTLHHRRGHGRDRAASDLAGDASDTGGDPGTNSPVPVWSSAGWRTAMAFSMAALVAVGAAAIGPRVPNADDNDRFDLRRFQTPPFDPLSVPTPLGQVKAGLQDANADRTVFEVRSAEPIQRFPLAVLDSYNSEFWLVADETMNAAAEFRPVDTRFPDPTNGTIEGWPRVEATIEIVDLDRLAGGEFDPVWLPTAGWPITVTSDDRLDLRFNDRSGTIALPPDGPAAGLVYDMVAATPPDPGRATLESAGVTTREPFDLAVPQLRSFAADVLEGADVGWEQVEAIRTRLVDSGAYDSRAASSTGRPGHSLGRLAEFVDDPDSLAGFEEQYAATAALLARSQGLQARVVVGFHVDDDELELRRTDGVTQVLASDIVAWLEVRFDGVGWVPFDVTPPRDREPEDSPVGRTEREVAVPNPPPDPPPPILPPDLDLEADLDEEIEEPDDDAPVDSGGFPLAPVLVGTGIAMPFVLLIGGMLLVVVLKRRRTERRRRAASPSLQVAGAWHELMDRFVEQGARPPAAATNREVAYGLADAELVADDDGDVLIALADDVDRAAFHPAPVDGLVAERAWVHSEHLRASVMNRQSVVARFRSRVDPRPLRTRDPLFAERTGRPASDVGDGAAAPADDREAEHA